MKIQCERVIKVYLEKGDPLAIRTTKGDVIYGFLAETLPKEKSFVFTNFDGGKKVLAINDVEVLQAPTLSQKFFSQPRLLVPAGIVIGIVAAVAEPVTAFIEEAIDSGGWGEPVEYKPPPVKPPEYGASGGTGRRKYHPFGCPCGGCGAGGIWVDG